MILRLLGAAAFSAALLFSSAIAPVRAADATMPTCPASDPVVWVNTSTHVYHKQGDKFFGKTKSGKYMCTSAATASGAHLSGTSTKSASAMTGASPKPAKMKKPKASPSPAS
jgi:phospholipase C